MVDDNSAQHEEDFETNDSDLENLVGNLLITEFQAKRLRDKLVAFVKDYYNDDGAIKSSVFPFLQNGEIWKIYLTIKKMTSHEIEA